MAWVKIHKEVPNQLLENDWNLCFQKVTYHYDDGNKQNGFRLFGEDLMARFKLPEVRQE